MEPEYHVYGTGTSRLWIRNVTFMEPECHVYGTGTSHLWNRNVTFMEPERHVYGTGMSRLWNRNVTFMEPECYISGFRREVDETSALLGHYAASSGNFLSTFRDNLAVPS